MSNKKEVTICFYMGLDLSIGLFLIFLFVISVSTALTRCTAADGMRLHLPELPFLTLSDKHTHIHTNVYKHMHIVSTHAESMIIPH